MLANDLNLSVHNPILIYSFLALYGLLTVLILVYIRTKFRYSHKALKTLMVEWTQAETRHAGFVGQAQEQISKLAVPAPAPPAVSVRRDAIGFDTRNQVVTMAKRGLGTTEIARSCGLQEGDVEVLLGMARLNCRGGL